MSILQFFDSRGKAVQAKVNDEGKIELADVTLEVGDVQIGAVEMKDATSANRAHVDPDGRLYTSISGIITATDLDIRDLSEDQDAVRNIDWAHKEIHDGNFYNICHIHGEVADDANEDLLFQAGSDVRPHASMGVSAEGKAFFTLTEDVIISASGTSLSPINRNRTSANTAESNAWHTPTVVSIGTTLCSGFLPGGEGNKTIGAISNDRDEWVLEEGKFYLLRIQNKGGAAKDIAFNVGFYEESV